MSGSPFLMALLFTTLAGLATGLGSLIALISRRTTPRFLSVSLGFSAGVMLFVSLVELFNDARIHLAPGWGRGGAWWGASIGFFTGMALIALIDHLVPPAVNPHEARAREAAAHEAADSHACGDLATAKRGARLLRTGYLTALVVAIHNFPEGIATLFASMESLSLGGTIALAIAIHNIPEGIAVSVPVYYATGSRRQAFWFSFASGLSEPVGALVGYLLLRPFLGGPLFGLILAAVAGIMVYISLDELLPTAREYGESHLAMAGLAGGMGVMAMSLALSGR